MIRASKVYHCVDWLIDTARNDFTQFGEDGLIEAVFDRIGTTNRYCFEVGANDGLMFSNTKRLRDLGGWRTVLIEADPKLYESLRKLDDPPRTQTINAKVTPDNFDDILASAGMPQVPDLGVIDIDGQDWWLWQGMTRCSPRVMLVEVTTGRNDDAIPELGAPSGQAGADHIAALGERKGYDLLARTHCNQLFVKRGGQPRKEDDA